MLIRKAKSDDLYTIFDIYINAIKVMNDNNIPQWDEIYPNINIIEQDIDRGQMFVCIKNNTIVSVGVINNQSDDEYKNCKWEYGENGFAVIHRLCVNPDYQNQKIGSKTMLLFEDLIRKEDIKSVRLDAFSLNPYALKMYKNLGYNKVGVANFRKGLFYLFEKKL